MPNSTSTLKHVVAWIGLDWADQQHAVCLQAAGSSAVEHSTLQQKPEALQLWLAELRCRFPQGQIAIALEQSRGSLFYALMNYDFLLLYPIPPKALADYRKALYPSGAKDDPVDAELLLEFLRKHPERFRPWRPDDAQTREIALLGEHRRQLVDDRTALTNRLRALLKGYFPQALEWAGDLSAPLAWDFLTQWPSLEAAKRAPRLQVLKVYRAHTRRSSEEMEQLLEQIQTARPLTTDSAVIESSVLIVQASAGQLRALHAGLQGIEGRLYRLATSHPDYPLFKSLPGAGQVLAPRLLAAWGSDRQRFQGAEQMQAFSGIAPVTERSGKRSWVHWRWACPKFLRQTFHEFAAQSRLQSPWAEAYYQQMRERGLEHQAAIRALAFKWIRIMYCCWKNRTPYNETRYQQALNHRASPLATRLCQLAIQEARA